MTNKYPHCVQADNFSWNAVPTSQFERMQEAADIISSSLDSAEIADEADVLETLASTVLADPHWSVDEYRRAELYLELARQKAGSV